MATHSNNIGVPTKRSWPRYPLRGHGEEEMGRELGIHGTLCVRCRPHLLGPLGPSHVVRNQADFNSGQAQCGADPKVSHSPIHTWVRADGRLRVLSVWFRCHYCRTACWVSAGEDELLRLDVVRPTVAHSVLHDWGIHYMGQWVS